MTDEELEKLAALVASRIKEPIARELRPAVEAVLKITARDEQSARELAEIGQKVDLTPLMETLAAIEERLPPPHASPAAWNPVWWLRQIEKMPKAWRESTAWWRSPAWWKRLQIAVATLMALWWVTMATVTGLGFWMWATPETGLGLDGQRWLSLRLTWW